VIALLLGTSTGGARLTKLVFSVAIFAFSTGARVPARFGEDLFPGVTRAAECRLAAEGFEVGGCRNVNGIESLIDQMAGPRDFSSAKEIYTVDLPIIFPSVFQNKKVPNILLLAVQGNKQMIGGFDTWGQLSWTPFQDALEIFAPGAVGGNPSTTAKNIVFELGDLVEGRLVKDHRDAKSWLADVFVVLTASFRGSALLSATLWLTTRVAVLRRRVLRLQPSIS
jgi:hypothetical protein